MKRFLPKSIVFWASAILIVLAGIVFVIFQFTESERLRNARDWQIRMGIIADSRHEAVERWLDLQFTHLRELAHNSSLQFYAMDLIEEDAKSPGEAPEKGLTSKEAVAEARYLLNLLTVTAERAGFKGPVLGAAVDANVSRIGVAGLALLNMKGKILAATQQMPPITGELAQAIKKTPKAKPGIIDIHIGNSGNPTVGFTAPVFAVQGNAVASDQVGILVGLKEISKELYPLLKQPGSLTKTGEALLVRQVGSVTEYISPLQNGTPPLKLKLATNTPSLAANFALGTPGGFAVKTDYRNKEVLVVGRPIASTPWTLIYKIDRDEAFTETDTRLTTILIVLIVTVLGVLATIIAVWRYGASVRANQAMDLFQRAAIKFENTAKFMRLMADNQPAQVFVVSNEGKYTFANESAAKMAGMSVEDMIGKELTSVVGPIRAEAFQRVNDKVLVDQKPVSEVYKFEEGGETHMYRASHTPLMGDDEHPPGVMVILNDVSEMIAIQERRDKAMRQLTRTLVTLVDRKDRYSAVHATLVAGLGVAISEELKLSESEKRTVELAGNLINLGKTFVPEEILVKKGRLTEEEHKLIENGMAFAVTLIEGIEFIGPVAQTLAQVHERWDGSGKPKGLVGEGIMIEARVIKVANELVGMVSPRSYREAHSYEETMKHLQKRNGTAHDSRVVAATTHFMENKDGKKLLSNISEPEAWDTPERLIETIAKLIGPR